MVEVLSGWLSGWRKSVEWRAELDEVAVGVERETQKD